jgi:DNA-binding transcriptional MerR regulator
MNKLFTAIIAGAFATSVLATEAPVTKTPVNIEIQNALEQWQNKLPDSVKTIIAAHQQQIDLFKTQIETQRTEFKAKMDAEKEAFKTKIQDFTKTLPDSLKNAIDVENINLPDSIKARIEAFKIERQVKVDSIKSIIDQRRVNAKADITTELAKLDSEKKAKYEKALVQLENKLADRQLKAIDAQKQLDAKRAEILAKIEQEKASKK